MVLRDMNCLVSRGARLHSSVSRRIAWPTPRPTLPKEDKMYF